MKERGKKVGCIRKIRSVISVLILLISIVVSVSYTERLKGLDELRDKRLELKELRKFEVLEEVRRLYLIKDERTYQEAKKRSKCSEELKSRLYGERFDRTKYFYGEEVRVLDAQYSLEGEESYFVLSEVKKGGKSYIVRSIVYVSGGQIYDMINI